MAFRLALNLLAIQSKTDAVTDRRVREFGRALEKNAKDISPVVTGAYRAGWNVRPLARTQLLIKNPVTYAERVDNRHKTLDTALDMTRKTHSRGG